MKSMLPAHTVLRETWTYVTDTRYFWPWILFLLSVDVAASFVAAKQTHNHIMLLLLLLSFSLSLTLSLWEFMQYSVACIHIDSLF